MDSSKPSPALNDLQASLPRARKLLNDLNTQGYTILRAHAPEALITRLLHSARKLTSIARGHEPAKSWPYLRTCPKQFPPWETTPEHGVWGVQHLLHPDLVDSGLLSREEARAFAETYFSDLIIGPVKEIFEQTVEDEASVGAKKGSALGDDDGDARGGAQNGETSTNGDNRNGCHPPSSRDARAGSEARADQDLVLELFNMLVTPPRDFSLRWHRDEVSFSLSTLDEATALGLTPVGGNDADAAASLSSKASPPGPAEPSSHYPSLSSSTPPSHISESQPLDLSYAKRKSKSKYTHTQYNLPLLPDSSLHVVPGSHLRPRTSVESALLSSDPYSDQVPGWVKVELQPGDVAFYDNNLIHRGVYSSRSERFTLHGSVGHVSGGAARSGNILQHGVGSWIGMCDFGRLLPIRGDDDGQHMSGGIASGERNRDTPRPSSDDAVKRGIEGAKHLATDELDDDRLAHRAGAMKMNLVALGGGERMAQGAVGYVHDD